MIDTLMTSSQQQYIKRIVPPVDTRRPPKPGEEMRGLVRKEPGEGGRGKYYHILLRSKAGFLTFRTRPTPNTQGVLEVLGKRPNGEWETQKILLKKRLATQDGRHLTVHLVSAKNALPILREPIRQMHDDLYFAPLRHERGRRFGHAGFASDDPIQKKVMVHVARTEIRNKLQNFGRLLLR